MKIILSRKGFDSENGGIASPILPDGSLTSLPIPSVDKGAIRYDRQRTSDGTLGKFVTDLTRGKYTGRHKAHLDPDLRASTLHQRPAGWRPIFGQAKQAQSHLAGEGVGPGDLFLFFGWFRRVELHQGNYRFVPDAPDLHVLFGWLQVGEVLAAGPFARAQAPAWAQYHTHFYNTWAGNTVYFASPTLTLPRFREGLPGGGVFPKFRSELCLTAPGHSRRVWHLPRCFAPTSARSIMSYHHDIGRWRIGNQYCHLQSVDKGQEFVINPTGRPGVMTWVRGLFNDVAEQPLAADRN
jgi:hypothetical protein